MLVEADVYFGFTSESFQYNVEKKIPIDFSEIIPEGGLIILSTIVK